jgi:tRNA G18 (ribose-2'-O)-methylase SpoU
MSRKPIARVNRHAKSLIPLKLYEDADIPVLLEGLKDPLVLVLDGIQDPHNLGAL